MASFCVHCANADQDHCREHHGAVFHTKEACGAVVNGLSVVMQKIPDHRADKIQADTNHQLHMCDGSRGTPHKIISSSK